MNEKINILLNGSVVVPLPPHFLLDTSNTTLEYHRGHAEAVLFSVWMCAMCIFTICGNVFVLYATIRHKAIKLDSMSIWIIKNLAAADILNGVINVFPIAVNSISGSKTAILGAFYCHLQALLQTSPVIANSFLINALQLNKIYRCQFPFRSLVVTLKQKLGVTTVVCIFSSFHAIRYFVYQHLICQGVSVIYISRFSVCIYYYQFASCWDKPVVHISSYSIDYVCVLIPMVTLVAASGVLISIAVRKSGTQNVNKSGILCFCLMTGVFVLSMTPLIVRTLRLVPDYLATLLTAFISLQGFSNVLIYYFTNTSFREFTRRFMDCRAGVKPEPQSAAAALRSSTVRNVTVRNMIQSNEAGPRELETLPDNL